VSVLGGFDRGSGAKRWKCNHCDQLYNGSYSRVRAHLLGLSGCGIKPCPAIDASSRGPFKLLDQEDFLTRKLVHRKIKNKKKKLFPSSGSLSRLMNLFGTNYRLIEGVSSSKMMDRAASNVDNIVARFFFADGLSLDVADSSFFHEMAKAIGAFGSGYKPPSMDQLSGSLLSKEKARIEKALALAKESWSHTGCTILCANRLDGSVGCFCVDFFVASPRGVIFLKEVDIIEGDGPDSQFIKELAEVIVEVGPSNVLQVITHISGEASDAFESVLISKFPHIFWSHCSSHSILFLLEEVAQLDWIQSVVSSAKELEQCISTFNSNILKEPLDPVSKKFAPSYCLVRRIVNKKSVLEELVASENWKQSKPSNSAFDAETLISSDDFWSKTNSMLEVCEPFVRLLAEFDVDKSLMGDIYNWRVLSLEALRASKIDESTLYQLEMLIESRWDKLFSPLHGAAYMLNPRYFKKGQKKDAHLIRTWNATLERYEADIEARKVLGKELSIYQKVEGCFGEEDAIESRDKMEPVSWWENFGFETPHLQNLAIRVLSQVSSAEIMCRESCRCDKMTCKEAVQMFGLASDRAKDFVFVRNNLRLQSLRNKMAGCQSDSRSKNSCSGSC